MSSEPEDGEIEEGEMVGDFHEDQNTSYSSFGGAGDRSGPLGSRMPPAAPTRHGPGTAPMHYSQPDNRSSDSRYGSREQYSASGGAYMGREGSTFDFGRGGRQRGRGRGRGRGWGRGRGRGRNFGSGYFGADSAQHHAGRPPFERAASSADVVASAESSSSGFDRRLDRSQSSHDVFTVNDAQRQRVYYRDQFRDRDSPTTQDRFSPHRRRSLSRERYNRPDSPHGGEKREQTHYPPKQSPSFEHNRYGGQSSSVSSGGGTVGPDASQYNSSFAGTQYGARTGPPGMQPRPRTYTRFGDVNPAQRRPQSRQSAQYRRSRSPSASRPPAQLQSHYPSHQHQHSYFPNDRQTASYSRVFPPAAPTIPPRNRSHSRSRSPASSFRRSPSQTRAQPPSPQQPLSSAPPLVSRVFPEPKPAPRAEVAKQATAAEGMSIIAAALQKVQAAAAAATAGSQQPETIVPVKSKPAAATATTAATAAAVTSAPACVAGSLSIWPISPAASSGALSASAVETQSTASTPLESAPTPALTPALTTGTVTTDQPTDSPVTVSASTAAPTATIAATTTTTTSSAAVKPPTPSVVPALLASTSAPAASMKAPERSPKPGSLTVVSESTPSQPTSATGKTPQPPSTSVAALRVPQLQRSSTTPARARGRTIDDADEITTPPSGSPAGDAEADREFGPALPPKRIVRERLQACKGTIEEKTARRAQVQQDLNAHSAQVEATAERVKQLEAQLETHAADAKARAARLRAEHAAEVAKLRMQHDERLTVIRQRVALVRSADSARAKAWHTKAQSTAQSLPHDSLVVALSHPSAMRLATTLLTENRAKAALSGLRLSCLTPRTATGPSADATALDTDADALASQPTVKAPSGPAVIPATTAPPTPTKVVDPITAARLLKHTAQRGEWHRWATSVPPLHPLHKATATPLYTTPSAGTALNIDDGYFAAMRVRVLKQVVRDRMELYEYHKGRASTWRTLYRTWLQRIRLQNDDVLEHEAMQKPKSGLPTARSPGGGLLGPNDPTSVELSRSNTPTSRAALSRAAHADNPYASGGGGDRDRITWFQGLRSVPPSYGTSRIATMHLMGPADVQERFADARDTEKRRLAKLKSTVTTPDMIPAQCRRPYHTFVQLHCNAYTTDGGPAHNSDSPWTERDELLYGRMFRVNDAQAVEQEAMAINPWSDVEILIFMAMFLEHPKQFRKISRALRNKTTQQCVAFYYRTKSAVQYKRRLREHMKAIRKRAGRTAWSRACDMANSLGVVLPDQLTQPVDEHSAVICVNPLMSDTSYHSSQVDVQLNPGFVRYQLRQQGVLVDPDDSVCGTPFTAMTPMDRQTSAGSSVASSATGKQGGAGGAPGRSLKYTTPSAGPKRRGRPPNSAAAGQDGTSAPSTARRGRKPGTAGRTKRKRASTPSAVESAEASDSAPPAASRLKTGRVSRPPQAFAALQGDSRAGGDADDSLDSEQFHASRHGGAADDTEVMDDDDSGDDDSGPEEVVELPAGVEPGVPIPRAVRRVMSMYQMELYHRLTAELEDKESNAGDSDDGSAE